MSVNRFILMVLGVCLFLPPKGYAGENPCLHSPESMDCLALKNPQSLAGDCSRDEKSRSCVCAQSCGISTLATHSEALNHSGYASCYKTGIISPLSGCLGFTRRSLNLFEALADAGDVLIR